MDQGWKPFMHQGWKLLMNKRSKPFMNRIMARRSRRSSR